MLCKCGFNSFDHNLVCPKCRRDLTAARRLLNLDFPAPGVVNFFQIAGQRMAVPQPVKPLPPHQAAMDQIKSTLAETGDLSPESSAPALHQAGAPGEGDDFSSLAGELNVDELEGGR
jgi:hypothetical protein